jgi:hypothetical protein
LLMLTAVSTLVLADGIDVAKHKGTLRPYKRALELAPLSAFVPDCFEGWHPRLLNCSDRVYVQRSGAVLMWLEAPPPRIDHPYPRLFSWPYGSN